MSNYTNMVLRFYHGYPEVFHHTRKLLPSAMGVEDVVVMGAYLSGAVAIVLFTLSIGWILVWKYVLAKMPFIQELFDLKPKNSNQSQSQHAEDDKTKAPLSFQDRYESYKRVRLLSLCACGCVWLWC